MAELGEDIKKITEEVLNDGTVENLIRQKVIKGFEDAIEAAFSYGELRDTIKKRVSEVLVPFIEGYNMDEYIVKLDTVLSEIISKTPLIDNKTMLENFKSLMIVPEEKVISVDALFEAYKKYIAKSIECSGRDVNYDDGVHYEPVKVNIEVSSDEDRSWRIFDYKTLDLFIGEDEEQYEKLGFSLRLSRWKDSSGPKEVYDISYYGCPDINSLRHMNDFEIFLVRLTRAGTKIQLGSVYDFSDSDEVYPDAEPEPTYC